jgi:hypothetical protein
VVYESLGLQTGTSFRRLHPALAKTPISCKRAWKSFQRTAAVIFGVSPREDAAGSLTAWLRTVPRGWLQEFCNFAKSKK